MGEAVDCFRRDSFGFRIYTHLQVCIYHTHFYNLQVLWGHHCGILTIVLEKEKATWDPRLRCLISTLPCVAQELCNRGEKKKNHKHIPYSDAFFYWEDCIQADAARGNTPATPEVLPYSFMMLLLLFTKGLHSAKQNIWKKYIIWKKHSFMKYKIIWNKNLFIAVLPSVFYLKMLK